MTRKCSALFALISAIALVITGLCHAAPQAQAAPSADTDSGKNVALAANGAKVTASGVESGTNTTPDAVIDGNPDTRWSSDYNDNAWLRVELKDATQIDHVKIRWEAACAPSYKIQVSNDDKDWKDATDVRALAECGQTETIKLNSSVANQKWKYVKLQALERKPINGVKYGVSLFEFEVWDGAEPTPAKVPNLVPLPKSVKDQSKDGTVVFSLTSESKIVATGDATAPANILAAELRAATGYDLPVVDKASGANNITFTKGAVTGEAGAEAYMLKTAADGATLTANSAHGFFNATRTLLQLLPIQASSKIQVAGPWDAPATEILDSPRYEYRSVMIDPARSFLTVAEVKSIIDQISNLKMSYLHIHLADDQGWRIQITNDGRVDGDDIDYNLLTEVSGKTAMNVHERQGSHQVGYSGFYTQADYKDIVKYAKSRYVTVVPEIDVPGHVNAALHAIPQLNTAGSSHNGGGKTTAPANGTGNVGYSYLDPDSQATWHFIGHVFKQLSEMTPGARVHIGGDEPHSFTGRYGEAKYNEVLTKVLKIVRDDCKKTPVGWNEIAATELKENDGIQYWAGGTDKLVSAAKNKHAKIVMSRGSSAYLDQKYNSKTPLGLTWAGCGTGGCSVQNYYNWNPTTDVVSGLSESDVLGPEMALWSETIRGGSEAEFMIWPRMAAGAEIGWTPQNARSFEGFSKRLASVGDRWTLQGQNFYDTDQVNWDYALAAPVKTTGATGKDVAYPLGRLVAPGTVLNDTSSVSPDTKDDADGVSKSQIPANTKVMVNWGDGTPATEATIQTDRERSAYNAPHPYYLTANHKYATDGDHTVTLTAGERTATTVIHTEGGAADPAVFTPWNPDATAPSAKVNPTEFSIKDRIEVQASGFKPYSLITMKVGDVELGQLRADSQGNVAPQWVFVDPEVLPGPQKMTFTSGTRVATVDVVVKNGKIVLKNPLKHDQLSVVDVDSQETVGEKAPATNAIDGDKTTFWHTQWQGTQKPFPHYITLALPADQTCTVTGFEYTPRQDNSNTRAKDYSIQVSNDNENWTTVHEGSLEEGAATQAVNFDQEHQLQAKYVKMVQKNSQNGDNFGGAAEIRVGAICKTADEPSTGGDDDDAQCDAQKTATTSYPTSTVVFPGNDKKSHKVTYDKNSFMVDGKRLTVWSGELHYWRLPDPNGWRDVLQKMRADGFNAVSLYFDWGVHQAEKDGKLEFTKDTYRDLDQLLTIAQQEGLYVIARPGPYVNAETSMGGLPAYMTNEAANLRSTNPEVLKASKAWLHAFNEVAAKHQVTDGGGSILLYQVENEMPNSDDAHQAFMKALVKQVKDDGITVPLFHNDWGLNGIFKDAKGAGLDLYAYDKYPMGFNCAAGRGQVPDTENTFRGIAPNTPHFIAESQGGAFTPWGANFQPAKCREYTDANFIRQWGAATIGNGVTAHNYYMEYGGTNWGWTGAPASGFTSYDYGAPLTEDRTITPKFGVQKELGYFFAGVPAFASMNPIAAPTPKVESGASLNVKARLAGDTEGSATGNGTRVLAIRHSDSNDTSTTKFTLPLALGKSGTLQTKEFSTDDTDSAITYNGSWKAVNDQTAWKSTLHRSTTSGDKATFTFDGTEVSLIVGTGTKNGTFTVSLDNGTPETITKGMVDTDQNKPSQVVAYKKTGLAKGKHTLVVTNTGTDGKTTLDIDAFDAVDGADSGAKVVNDNDRSFFTYSNAWTHDTNWWAAGDIEKDETSTDKKGETAEFTFTGVGFDLIGPFSENHGSATVTVDGKDVGKTKEEVTSSAQAQKVLFSWRDESGQAKKHTVKITVDGEAFSGSKGTFVAIDAVRYYPTADALPSDGSPKPGEIGWKQIPQQEGTSLTLHGRDALLITADTVIDGKQLYYTTSQIFGQPLPVNGHTTQYLVGYAGDAGETVFHFEKEPQVTLPEGATKVWDEKTGQLRLNYTHKATPQEITITEGGKALTLRIITRDLAQTTWIIQGANGSQQTQVAVEGVELARTATFDGGKLALTGSNSKAADITVLVPTGVKAVTWNGTELKVADGVATGKEAAPNMVKPITLQFVKHTDNAYAAKAFDDSKWKTASDTTAANPKQQGPQGNQKVVLDSNHYGFYEGSVWYRAHYKATSDQAITLNGNGGSDDNHNGPAFMQVWANGHYVGAYPANGTDQQVTLPEGAVQAGKDVVLAVLVNNIGQNLDWSDNGLSKQNRGLKGATIASDGDVTWKIEGATTADAAKHNPSGSIYNNGGLAGEKAGWHMPGFDDKSWEKAETLHSAAGVTWYRSTFDLNVTAGKDVAFHLDLESERAPKGDKAQATIFVNGWNTGVYIGDAGPQTSFTVPKAFLHLNGKNTVAIAIAAKSDTMGPEAVTLRAVHTTTLPKVACPETPKPDDPNKPVNPDNPTAKTALTVTPDVVKAGEATTLKATGFTPDKLVVFTVNGVKVGEAKADGNGQATVKYTVPASSALGKFAVVASQPDTGLSATSSLTVVASDQAKVQPNPKHDGKATDGKAKTGPSHGKLARTGVALRGVLVAMLLSAAAGFALTRRRRRDA